MKNEENKPNPLLDQIVALQQRVGELDDKVNHYEQQLAQERATRQTIETRLQKTEERLSLLLRATKDAIYECDIEAELRQQQECLHLANERFQFAAWAVKALIYDWQIDTNRVERTDGLTNILGYSLSEAEPTRRWWRDRIHPDDVQSMDEEIARALSQGDSYQIEYRVLHKNNHYIPILEQGRVVTRDNQGNPMRIIGSRIDIRDRKAIEATLKQRETDLRLITDAVPALIAYVDSECRYRFVNRAFTTWFGHSAEHLMGESVADFVGAQVYEYMSRDIEAALAGESVKVEMWMPFKDGGSRYVRRQYIPDIDPQGHVMEISELKRVEAALRMSEAFAHARVQELETLMEITPVALWIAHDPHCHQMTANHTAYNLMRMPQGSVTTATPADGSYPLPFKQYKNGQEYLPHDLPMQRAARTGQEVVDEIEFVFEDGTVRFLYGKAVPLYHDSGEVRGVIGAFVDITERKQAEREREHLLARERAARKEAESANRIKDEFLAILSHELRSPLNPILGWTKLLRTRQFDQAATDKALATIERNATIQIQLVDDLLDVARILRGKVSLTRHRVDLAIAIKAAIETVQLAAEAKSIQIQPHFIGKVGLVEGDSGRLQQVVWNLLSNAVKFTPSGGQVEVTLATVDEFAQITVSDTGIGISADILPHIFDYFRQADSSMTRQFGGLGLGLAIARHIVDLHGGIIEAESPGEGQGATFTVKLPLLPDQRKPTPNTPDCQRQPDTPPLQGIRVLFVDDEADTRELIGIILQQAGAEVITMASAPEVLSQFNQLTIDILVSDIGMPQMNGYDLLQQIRGMSSSQAQIPAIALTAYAGESNQQKALAAGFQQHLPKPVDPKDLIQAIVQLMKQ